MKKVALYIFLYSVCITGLITFGEIYLTEHMFLRFLIPAVYGAGLPAIAVKLVHLDENESKEKANQKKEIKTRNNDKERKTNNKIQEKNLVDIKKDENNNIDTLSVKEVNEIISKEILDCIPDEIIIPKNDNYIVSSEKNKSLIKKKTKI